MEAQGMNRGKLVFMGLILALTAYQLAVPYLNETKEMEAQVKKVKEEVRELREGASLYDSAWEKTMKEKEAKLSIEIPDNMNSALVLDYYLSEFERKYPDKIRFLSVNHQSSVAGDIKIKGEKGAVSPRIARYKIRAEVLQEGVVPYLEHIEKFNGLTALEGFNLTVPAEKVGPYLSMELVVAFFLMPREWVSPDKLQDPIEPPPVLGALEEQSWFQVFSSEKTTGSREVSSVVPAAEKYPRFKVSQIVGDGIVVGETLYEEGDFIQGWKVVRVEVERKSVVLKKGTITRRVSVP